MQNQEKENQMENSRPIRFRAWNQTTKNMLDVTLIKWHQSGMMQVEVDDWNKTDTIMDEYELMQFTGLFDKNGKEIYEGDIVKFDAGNGFRGAGEVFFKNGCFMHSYVEEIDPDSWRQPKIFKEDVEYEVIGNILTGNFTDSEGKKVLDWKA